MSVTLNEVHYTNNVVNGGRPRNFSIMLSLFCVMSERCKCQCLLLMVHNSQYRLLCRSFSSVSLEQGKQIYHDQSLKLAYQSFEFNGWQHFMLSNCITVNINVLCVSKCTRVCFMIRTYHLLLLQVIMTLSDLSCMQKTERPE